MTQQQWGWNPYGQPPPRQGYGYPPPGFGRQPGFGPQGYGRGFGGPQLPTPYGPPSPYGPTSPYGPRPPVRRRRSPLGGLLLALIVLGGLAVFGLAGTNLSTGSAPEGSYQNDDYQVPPPDTTPPELPLPETYEEAEQWVTDSAVYRQTAPNPVRCETQPVEVATASDRELDAHFEELMACLVRVWEPPLAAASFQVVRPTVTIYGASITTKCGEAGVNAFYCAADQQTYFSNQLADGVPIVRTDRWAADVVMAHEFGHALQGRTGILISAKALGQNSGDKATSLQYSRRLEVQADCLSGMSMRSLAQSLGIQQTDVEGILETYQAVGDDTVTGQANVQGNHGLARSRVYWGEAGLGTSEVGACNTFTAPASRVR